MHFINLKIRTENLFVKQDRVMMAVEGFMKNFSDDQRVSGKVGK